MSALGLEVEPPKEKLLRQRPWTGGQIRFLRANYPTASREELMRELPHSWGGIMHKARELKIHRRGRSGPKSDHPVIAKLVALRLEKRISVALLAQLADVDRCTVFQWESGSCLPSMRNVEKWAAALRARIVVVREDGT